MRRGLIHLNKTHTSFTQRLISFFFCLGLFTLSFYYIVKDQVQREKGIKEIRHSSFLFTGGSFHYSHSERYLQVIKVVPCASLPFSLPLFFHAVHASTSFHYNRMKEKGKRERKRSTRNHLYDLEIPFAVTVMK